MKREGEVRQALAEFSECLDLGNSVAVPTQHLYPSNRGVTVYVEAVRSDAFRVTDNGGAIEELSSIGLDMPPSDRPFYAVCRDYGVEYHAGVVQSPPVSIEGLSTAVIFVATASARVVEKMKEKLKPARHRQLLDEIEVMLIHHFTREAIAKRARVSGASNKQYDFDFAVFLPNDKRLLIDEVLLDAASINAKVVANIDVSKNEDPTLVQRLVYDDEEEWGASELSLLQMAATTIPFSRFDANLTRLSSSGQQR